MTNLSNEYERITGAASGSLDETLYVDAGAGTGKTRALVRRIVSLVTHGAVKPENIAAITFTIAAASELRQRVRAELEIRLDEARRDSNVQGQAVFSSALTSIDSAFIGTIHSFAQSLLRERPLDVGLPPVFELIDEVQGVELFQQEWDEWLEDTLENPEFSNAVLAAQRHGLVTPFKNLRELASEFHASYDLIQGMGLLAAPTNSISAEDSLLSIKADLSIALNLKEYCSNTDDLMFKMLDAEVALTLSWIEQALDDGSTEEQLLVLTQLPKFNATSGNQKNWNLLASGDNSLREIKANLKAALTSISTAKAALGAGVVVSLVNSVAEMVTGYAEKRRKSGTLEFQDLLVLSCQLLTESAEARQYFQARYSHVLIDEFQDTDPLQLKLAILLSDRAGSGVPNPGALFIVGDPKQSIYRFRRADLKHLKHLVDSLKAEPISLSTNYRSRPEILDWVNTVFEPWMNGPDGSDPDPDQAEYERFDASRSAGPSAEKGKPRVMMMGNGDHIDVDAARAAEAEDVAQFAMSIGAGNWTLEDRDEICSQSNYRDLCVLMPRRTALPALEAAFVKHGVPYVLEGQSPVFESQVFQELGNNLAAIDDPTDQVAIVASLKSSVWGCSDQDLFEWAQLKLKFEYGNEPIDLEQFSEGSGARRVALALTGLAEFHAHRQMWSTPYLIEWFIRKRRIRELAALMDPAGDRERLLDLFVEMSRKLRRSGTGSLREFVRWLTRQAEENVRVAEGAFANSDINAVRVMTIHASKGLEFPIVALMGLQVRRPNRQNHSIFGEQAGTLSLAVRLGSEKLGLSTENFTDTAKEDDAAGKAETIRLIYVGATRAREHLAVSLHRPMSEKPTSTSPSPAATIAGLIESEGISVEAFEVEFGGVRVTGDDDSTVDVGVAEYSTSDRENWIGALEQTVETASNRGYVTPSKLADHTMLKIPPKPEDSMESTELNPDEKGRGGTKFGSAVHAVLQDVDFADLTDLDELVRSAAYAHEVPDSSDEIAQAVRNTLASPTIARATANNSWREAWVAAEISEGVEIEGYIDLVVRNDDGTVTIVDYKTDQVQGADLEKRATGYEPQLAGYALVLEKLGMPVRDAVLVFASGAADGAAFEYPVPDLESAKNAAASKAQTEVTAKVR